MVDVISDLKSTPDRVSAISAPVWELGLSGKPSTEVTVVYFIMSNVDAWFVEPGGGAFALSERIHGAGEDGLQL